jgi:hypothetical protein
LEVDDAENEAEHGRESSPELVELSALEMFSSALQDAQRRTSAMEEPRKRARAPQNHGKSERTMRRHKKAKRDLEAQGFFSVQEFFKRKAKSAGQEGSNEALQVVQSEEHEGQEEIANEETHNAETEVVGYMSGSEGNAASIPALAEVEVVVEVEAPVTKDKTDEVTAVRRFEEEEEEEEEEEASKTEDETKPTSDACSVGATSIPGLPQWHSSDMEQSCWRWAAWPILLESEESESESSYGDTTVSDLEDLHSTDARELEGLHRGDAPNNPTTQQPSGNTADLLQNRAGLWGVHRELAVKARLGDLDTVLRGRVVAMVALLNLFLDETLGYTWRQASEVVAKTEGRGIYRARLIRQWTIKFARTKELPTHKHGQTQLSVLNDENITHAIKEALAEKAKRGFITTADIMEVVSGPDIQDQFAQAGIFKPSIGKTTACRWLGQLGWRHGRHQNGMYVDGHEREDVVKYRRGFVERFKEYERHFHAWDDEGMSCHAHQASLWMARLAAFILCLSLTMNPRSTKMTSDKFIGAVQERTSFQDRRARALVSWSQTFSLRIGAFCVMRTGAFSLSFPSQNPHHFPGKPV